jgi:AcrR family transcriptional regulator
MQKREENEDLRIRRTRKILQQAFLDLTVEKGFAALTVRDITERAMVNRSTFYRHYLDKYDLLEQYMHELYEMTGESETEDQDAPAGPLNLLRHIQQFADFYRVMLGEKGDPYFVERFRQNTQKRFHAMFAHAVAQAEPGALPLDLKIDCIAYAGVGAIVWWLKQEQPCSPAQFATWLGHLSSSIAGPALKPEKPGSSEPFPR